jgi:hypothetical protein
MPPIFGEGMNCGWKVHRKQKYTWITPTGSGEFKPDKVDKKGVRWNMTFEYHDKASIDEAGTSSVIAWRGCQLKDGYKHIPWSTYVQFKAYSFEFKSLTALKYCVNRAILSS